MVWSFQVVGRLGSVDFQKVTLAIEILSQKKLVNAKLVAMRPFDFNLFIDNSRKFFPDIPRGDLIAFEGTKMNNKAKIIGSTMSLVAAFATKFDFMDPRPSALYQVLAKQAYINSFTESNNKYVFLDFTHCDILIGRIVIELLTENNPKAVENFVRLASEGFNSDGHKMSYQNSVVHRIVKGGWLQAGDLNGGKGNSSESSFGGQFEDETHAVKHNQAGVVGMANRGRHSNGSQFYITFGPQNYLNTKCMAFGRCIDGYGVLKSLEKIETSPLERPADLKISDSGVWDPNTM